MSFPHAKSLFVALGVALCCNASPIFAQHGEHAGAQTQHGGQHNAPRNEAHGNSATAATKATPPANPLTLTDMAGRKVVIPDITDRPYRVFGSAPPLNVLLHVINPENMIGLSFAVPPAAAEFFPPRVSRLPVLGGVFGQGPQMNAEAVLALQPDFAIGWKSPFVDANRIEAGFARMGLPVVFIQLDTLADWPAALRFTGKLLRQEKRGEELALEVERTLHRLDALKTIPEARRPRVYYAEGPDGLTTDCHLSFHTEALELAGAYNVYRCTPKDHYGMEKVSLEQVLAYAPDIILTHDRDFASLVRQSPRWQGVKAVREGRIHLIPRWPHNWVDRPPSVMRALGALWLANLFYPTDFPLDVPTETRRFYRLFLGQELSDAQLEGLFR